MIKSVLVLAVPHQLQGPNFPCHVDDPSYRKLVSGFLRSVDLVFEEAAGCGPSIAEELALSALGASHYLDIDPARHDRHKYGIAAETEEWLPINPSGSSDMYSRLILGDLEKREELWLHRIRDRYFQQGLVICAIGHGLSFAFRLRSAGFGDIQLCNYIPYEKLAGG